MKTGTIKFWNDLRGFGFIIPDEDDQDVFAHISVVVPENHYPIHTGMRVQYEDEKSERGVQALRVVFERQPSDVDVMKARLDALQAHNTMMSWALRNAKKTLRRIQYEPKVDFSEIDQAVSDISQALESEHELSIGENG